MNLIDRIETAARRARRRNGVTLHVSEVGLLVKAVRAAKELCDDPAWEVERRTGKLRATLAPLYMTDFMRDFYQRHQEERPWCKYGNTPHFAPPSFLEPGFFMCDADKPEAEPEDTHDDR